MSHKEVIEEAKLHSEPRGWAWEDNRTIYLIELLLSRDTAKRSLLSKVDAVQRDLDSIKATLERGRMLNMLGELQQRPGQVEAAVGEYQTYVSAIEKFLTIFPPPTDK